MTTSGRVVAGIDCGTNSIRLLVAELHGDGTMTELVRLMRIVRLGEGVDRTGEFSTAALSRTFTALDEYAVVMAQAGVGQTRFVATSASRDVSNRAEFAAGVSRRVDVEPDVISGQEEASLSFVGAVRGLPSGLVTTPALIVDIGGGSTEFVFGEDAPSAAVSVDIGCVRMTERHLVSDPPTAGEIASAIQDIDAAVSSAARAVPLGDADCFVGLAGTVTTVAAMSLGLDRYDADVLHGCVISASEVDRVTEQLLVMTRAQRADLPFMHPGRVDVIGAGALILRAAVSASGRGEVIVSETDILDGIVYSMSAD